MSIQDRRFPFTRSAVLETMKELRLGFFLAVDVLQFAHVIDKLIQRAPCNNRLNRTAASPSAISRFCP